MLRTLGCVYAILALTGALLQRNPPSYEAKRATPTVKVSSAGPAAPVRQAQGVLHPQQRVLVCQTRTPD